MSGGSYNYLCTKDVDELTPHNDDLAHMIERLDGIGWATAAAANTRAVRDKLRAFHDEIQALLTDLEPVWHAVEWRDSGDWDDDQLRAALVRYEAAHLDT